MIDLKRPTLIIDKQKCLSNIRQMADKASRNDLIFRPHFKTHQSKVIGKWFNQFGVEKITVSSLTMAKYFADAGWKDITIAFPFNQLEIAEINELAAEIELNILLIHTSSAAFLQKHLKQQIGIFIEIDCGYHRSGIPAENIDEIDDLIKAVSNVEKLNFKGFLTHSGHTYHTRSIKQIIAVHEVTKFKMNLLKKRFISQFPNLIISVGDTPSCSLAEDFSGIDEIRPGNFVFYDVMQFKLGVCDPRQIAVAVACPVVAKNKQKNEVIIYGGAVHLAKEFTIDNRNRIYGLVVELQNSGWSQPIAQCYVSSLSQEHGIIKVSPDKFEQFKIGDVLGILPVHSCLTANLMREYLTLDGEVLEHL